MKTNNRVKKFTKFNYNTVVKKYSILAMFSNHHKVSKAIKNLKKNGCIFNDIFLLKSKKIGEKNFAYHLGTYLKSGAIIGGIIGFVVLGIAGFVIGLKDPMMLGVSSLFKYTVVGLLMGTIFGVASGALVGIGAPKAAVKRYSYYIKEGGIVLMVQLRDRDEDLKISHSLEVAGGQDINLLEESHIWHELMPDAKEVPSLKSITSLRKDVQVIHVNPPNGELNI